MNEDLVHSISCYKIWESNEITDIQMIYVAMFDWTTIESLHSPTVSW